MAKEFTIELYKPALSGTWAAVCFAIFTANALAAFIYPNELVGKLNGLTALIMFGALWYSSRELVRVINIYRMELAIEKTNSMILKAKLDGTIPDDGGLTDTQGEVNEQNQ